MARIMCYHQLLSAHAFISAAHHLGSSSEETDLSIDGLTLPLRKRGA